MVVCISLMQRLRVSTFFFKEKNWWLNNQSCTHGHTTICTTLLKSRATQGIRCRCRLLDIYMRIQWIYGYRWKSIALISYTLRQLSHLSAKEEVLVHDRLCIGARYTRFTSFKHEIGVGGTWEMFYARVRRSTGELCSASTIEGPKLLGRARKVEFGSNHGGLKQFSCTPDRTWGYMWLDDSSPHDWWVYSVVPA